MRRLRAGVWVGCLLVGMCLAGTRAQAEDAFAPTDPGSERERAASPDAGVVETICPSPLAYGNGRRLPVPIQHLILLHAAGGLDVREEFRLEAGVQAPPENGAREAKAGAVLRWVADACRDAREGRDRDVSGLAPGWDEVLHRNEIFGLPGSHLLRTDAGSDGREEADGTAGESADPLEEAMQLILLGMDLAARDRLEAFLGDLPGHSDGWRFLGDCRYRLGDVGGALVAYEKALRLSRTNYFALRGKAQCHLRLGTDLWNRGEKAQAHEEYRIAQALFLQCLRQQPADGDARYGHSLSAEGLTRHLLPLAMRGLEGTYAEEAKDVIRNCLEILDNAVTESRLRLQTSPDDHEARLVLADILLKRGEVLHPFGHLDEARGNVEAAAKELRRILEAEPEPERLAEAARARLASCRSLIATWQGE